MVTVFLRGGLGNQMFQYAAGLALAERNKTGLTLDTVFLNDRLPRKEFSYRNFDLDVFSLEPKFTRLSKISTTFPIPGMWLGLDLFLMTAGNSLGIHKLLKEKNEFVFQQEVVKEKGDVILWGRWQSDKYFAEIADKIRKTFTFSQELTGEAAVLRDEIRSSQSVALHVRRGDYVAFKNMANMMGDTDVAYYERAIRYIVERVEHPKVFIFSDDIEWCKKNISISSPVVYVSPSSAGPKDAFHLQLMSLCRHNIIANSTFSWWGAWLNSNTEKIVVAPMRWYTDNSSNADRTPISWIKL